MSRAVAYKGFTIRPAPQHVAESGMWGLNVFISWSSEKQEHSLHFFTAELYATKDEAEMLCIGYGKLVIDGEVSGASVG